MVRTHRAWKTFDRRTVAAALSIMLAWRDEIPNLDFGIVDPSYLIHRICQTNSPKLSACPSFFSRQGWRLRRAPAGQEPTAPAALYCESDCN